MTRIEEDAFTLDLPGEWEGIGSEPGTLAYREVGGQAMLVVQPLNVRPLFAIAEKMRLMHDYAEHRSKYETGQSPSLMHAEPAIEDCDGVIDAWWDGEDNLLGSRQRHRALLRDDVLVDFCYSAPEMDYAVFDGQANETLAGVALAE